MTAPCARRTTTVLDRCLLDAIAAAARHAPRRGDARRAGAARRRCATSPAPAFPAAPSCSWRPCRDARASRPARAGCWACTRPRPRRWAASATRWVPTRSVRSPSWRRPSGGRGPHEVSVDVGFAPTPALTDLAARPRTSRRTLALSRWSAATRADADGELAPAALELVADPDAPDALALRERATGTSIVPASFARLRSRTAPAGIARLLVGWSLWRQHASWALPLGPLAELAFIPRLCLDGFVIAPASWRLPADARTPAAIRRWRRAAAVPRHVQVGDGDELLPVDLTAPTAAADLADHDRVFEIWPPLDEIVDRDGRRLEAVVMLIEEPDAHDAAAHAPARRADSRGRRGAAAGARARLRRLADVQAVRRAGPAGRPARRGCSRRSAPASTRARSIAGSSSATSTDRAAGTTCACACRRRAGARRARSRAGCAIASAGPRADAIVTGVEVDDYRPELGRFRADELGAVHDIFESDSELACALLPPPGRSDRAHQPAGARDRRARGRAGAGRSTRVTRSR